MTIRFGKGRVENTNAGVSPSSSDFTNETVHVALPAGDIIITAQLQNLNGNMIHELNLIGRYMRSIWPRESGGGGKTAPGCLWDIGHVLPHSTSCSYSLDITYLQMAKKGSKIQIRNLT